MTTRFFPDLDDQVERRFRCCHCFTDWDEDDLQQSQPDGHYACPFEACGDDSLELADA